MVKSHLNDAFIIAGGNLQERCKYFIVEFKRKNNRSLQLNRKGFKPSIRKQRYPLQPKDIVKLRNKIFKVKGSHCNGKRILVFNDVIKKPISIAVKKLEIIYHEKTNVWSTYAVSSPP